MSGKMTPGPIPAALNGCMCQDGMCEACNRVVGAFEAMQGALREAIESEDLGKHADLRARAALALADKVSRP